MDSLLHRGQIFSEALIRVASGVRRPYFRHHLEGAAYDVTVNLATQNFLPVLDALKVVNVLVLMGANFYEIEPMNSRMLLEEAVSIEKEIKEVMGVNKLLSFSDKIDRLSMVNNDLNGLYEKEAGLESDHNIDIKDSVGDEPKQSPNDSRDKQSSIGNPAIQPIDYIHSRQLPNRNRQFGNPAIAESESAMDNRQIGKLESANRQMTHDVVADSSTGLIYNGMEDKNEAIMANENFDVDGRGGLTSGGGLVSIGGAIRQSAILEKIRVLSLIRNSEGQIVGCKMKDLLNTFPDISERTLRNDIQRLLIQGLVVRMGNGGAGSAYVIK